MRQRKLLRDLHISCGSHHELGLCSALAAPDDVKLSLHEAFNHPRAVMRPCWVLSWSNEQLSRIVKLHLQSTATPRVGVLPRLSKCESLTLHICTGTPGHPAWELPDSLKRLNINLTSLKQVAMPWGAGLQEVTAVADSVTSWVDDVVFERLGQLPPRCSLELLITFDTDPAEVLRLGQVKSFLTKVEVRFWDLTQEMAEALAKSVMPTTALDIWCGGVRGAGVPGCRGTQNKNNTSEHAIQQHGHNSQAHNNSM
jgi:hypothetical protein